MSQDAIQQLNARVEKLEARLRFHHGLAIVLGVALLFGSMTSLSTASQNRASDAKLIRASGIVIEDEQGRDRIVIGSPVPNPREGRRSSPSTGLVINDAEGYERFWARIAR